MEGFEFRQLSPENGVAEYEMLQDIGANENGFTNEVYGMIFEQYKEWLIRQDDYSKSRNLPENFIPKTTYFLYMDKKPVGIARIRYFSADFLESRGGWKLWLCHCKDLSRERVWEDFVCKCVGKV